MGKNPLFRALEGRQPSRAQALMAQPAMDLNQRMNNGGNVRRNWSILLALTRQIGHISDGGLLVRLVEDLLDHGLLNDFPHVEAFIWEHPLEAIEENFAQAVRIGDVALQQRISMQGARLLDVLVRYGNNLRSHMSLADRYAAFARDPNNAMNNVGALLAACRPRSRPISYRV